MKCRKSSELLKNFHKKNILTRYNSKSLLANVYDDHINDFVIDDNYGLICGNKSSTERCEFNMLKRELKLIAKEIRKITKKLELDENTDSLELDWKFVGMVLDRLCLFTFGIITFISTLTILFTSSNFFKFA